MKDISLAEAATIAGMIQKSSTLRSDRHPETARTNNTVLAGMARDGMVAVDVSEREQQSPVNVATFEGSSNELAPYYVDAVNRATDQRGDLEPGEEQALRVETTIDPDLQTAAEKARHQLELLDKTGRRKAHPEGAMVALDPRTGKVLAMVGGRSYVESQLNRATDAKRQPGSVFKPFVYAAAFESGISPLSTYHDAPQTFRYDHTSYSPGNYGRAYSMREVLLRDGLVRSLNVVTVDRNANGPYWSLPPLPNSRITQARCFHLNGARYFRGDTAPDGRSLFGVRKRWAMFKPTVIAKVVDFVGMVLTTDCPRRTDHQAGDCLHDYRYLVRCNETWNGATCER